jgi:hypothetical protein
MQNNPLKLSTAATLSILGAVLVVLPFFIEPRKSPVRPSNKTAVNLDATTTRAVSPRTSMNPEFLARSFIHPGQRTMEGAGDNDRENGPTPKPDAEPTVADWFRPLGKITDEAGTVRLYFKNVRDGRLLRIRQDGVEENGIALLGEKDDQYLVSINGERYIVPRRRK